MLGWAGGPLGFESRRRPGSLGGTAQGRQGHPFLIGPAVMSDVSGRDGPRTAVLPSDVLVMLAGVLLTSSVQVRWGDAWLEKLLELMFADIPADNVSVANPTMSRHILSL